MKRDKRIDILKGAAILLVVIGHINAPERLTDFIYSFHMPLFMFLSGFTFWISFEKRTMDGFTAQKVWEYIIRRIGTLIIPFISWNIIITWIQGAPLSVSAFFVGCFLELRSLWFLPTLFCLIIMACIAELLTVTAMSEDKCRGGAALICNGFVVMICTLAIALLYKVTSYTLFRETLIYVLPFFVGVYVRKYGFIMRIYTNQIILSICLVLSCILIPMYRMNDKTITNLAVRFMAGVLFTNVIYNYMESREIHVDGIERMLEYFGRHSLEIYIIHGFFRELFPAEAVTGSFYSAILRIASSVIICFVSVFIADFLKGSKVFAYVLFGKKAHLLSCDHANVGGERGEGKLEKTA